MYIKNWKLATPAVVVAWVQKIEYYIVYYDKI